MINRPEWVSRLGNWLRNYIPLGRLSYSQEGEDLVLARILGELKIMTGFFVDIGAHHPTRYSNTYYFYRRGWRGINVDALPGTKRLFDRMRRRDITIECGVGSHEGVLKYFAFNEPALNTFSEQEAEKKISPQYHIINTLQIPVVTLKRILDEHLPSGTKIDFMTIDAEGFDHEIISSNDWNLYRPRVVLVELLNTDIQNLETHHTAQILYRHNYRALAKTFNTYFFVANEAFPRSI
ncbi:MAG: FkbM family methyltransferase [Sulfuriferula sp.]